MKVIKRDGRAVDYDRQKISIAINKANVEVTKNEQATKEEIKKIIDYIEILGKKRMLVEDIQDIIEQKLMEMQRYELAKKYIVYRYTRALVRKQNTTDESILGIIRNEEKNLADENKKSMFLACLQRDYIAGEVSRDLTKRLLLPEKITKADEEGILHFHNTDYFIQPMINSSIINLQDMLDNGTIINDICYNSPEDLMNACILTTQIIINVMNNQYGNITINIDCLGRYLRKTYNMIKHKMELRYKENLKEIANKIIQEEFNNEITQGIKIIYSQLNTLLYACKSSSAVSVFIHLDNKNEYVKELAMIAEEIFKQSNTNKTIKLIYVLDENNNLSGGEYDYITNLSLDCYYKYNIDLSYISAKKYRENYKKHNFNSINDIISIGKFNQGVVTINLPQIAIVSDGNKEKFWKELKERLELCKEALMCRHYSLLGTNSDVSPIHWQNGAISRFNKGEKIDNLLKSGDSTLSLGYIGIYETTKLMTGNSHTKDEGYDFAIELIKKMDHTVKRWRKETGLSFVLCGTLDESLCYKFAKIDKERYGTVEDITDKGFYTSSYNVEAREEMNLLEKMKFESNFQDLSNGSIIYCTKISNNKEELVDLIKFIYNNIAYVKLTK